MGQSARYLPGLESTEAFRFNHYGPNGAVFAGWEWAARTLILCLLIPVLSFYLLQTNLQAMSFVIALLTLSLYAYYLIWRFSFFGLAWKTDKQGLTIRGFIVSRYVEWEKVTDFSVESYVFGNTCYVLKTDSEVYRIPNMETASGIRLTTSIWQHLPNLQSERAWLPLAATRLFKDIPENIPQEIEWTTPSEPLLWLQYSFVALIIAIPVYIWRHDYFLLFMLAYLIFDTTKDSFYTGKPVKSVRVDSTGIQIKTKKGNINLQWSEIGYAEIDKPDRLQIGADHKICFSLSVNKYSSTPRELLLAIARGLREHNSSQIIPVPVN